MKSTSTPLPSTPFSGAESNRLMGAIVFRDYGGPDVLEPAQVSIPHRLPGQVLIRVQAASVNPIDYRIRRGQLKRVLLGGFPRIPGYDVAGSIADCATDAPFVPGDRVIAFLDSMRGGACAEYARCSIDVVAKLPDSIAFEEGAAIPLAGTTALQSLRNHGRQKAGDRVLINGASGGVGTFAVQIAKALGGHVTAIASGHHEAFCRELGADEFINYKNEDFTQSRRQWDLIFDAAGKSNFWDARQVLSAHGRFVTTEPDFKNLSSTILSWVTSQRCRAMLAKPSGDDLRFLLRLQTEGRLRVIIDSRFPMIEARRAHERIEQGVDRGKIVLLHRLDPAVNSNG